tara:strand:+ start:1068 stop:1571 length:504 start_codon:yes stop_codon:yes gene_type:complete
MLLEFPNAVIVVLNVTVIPICHVLPSWFLTRMTETRFDPESWLFRARRWEMQGRVYERLLVVRRWKDLLPDGAPWLGGFAKRSLVSRDVEYVCRFRLETCRGELAHHLQIPCVLIVLLWNPWPVAALTITGYALISNVPCIVAQRHTRHRLSRLLMGLQKDLNETGR